MDREPDDAMVVVVETLTGAFEKHAAVMRASSAAQDTELGAAWREVEATLLPLARVIPTRLRPDLDEQVIDDLVFITMGATASLCLRIALLRPPEADRDRLIDTAARMLLAAF